MAKRKAPPKKKYVNPAYVPVKHNIKDGDTVEFKKQISNPVLNRSGYKIGDKVKVDTVKSNSHIMGGYQVKTEDGYMFPIVFFTDDPLWFGASYIIERKKDD